MSIKEYNYSVSISDDKEVFLSIKYISDGNSGITKIKVPHLKKSLVINNEGSTLLGSGTDLISKPVSITSDILNIIPEETDITIQYAINNTPFLTHTNSKSEDKSPCISIVLHFRN